MDYQVFISLGIYMLGMILIGLWAYKRTSNISDYMIGGRELGPAVTALSAGASDMSGWMVMGLPGAMYATGLASAWLAIGLTIGAYFNYILLAPRLRTYTEVANDSITIPDYLENRFQDSSKILRLVSGIVILVFFALYASAGMVSGGKLFESAFGLSYETGLFVTVGVIVIYTLFGGFIAVSWTDFVQGVIMLLALIIVPIVAFTEIGGPTTMWTDIKQIDPSRLDLFKGTSVLGIISFIAWGLGYFGQPHIIVRFMAIKDIKDLKVARRIGIGWMAISLIGAMLVGLIGISYFQNRQELLSDPETVLIVFANILFHPYVTGFVLAAILAAIMSTVSSQLLVTSSALTEDFYRTFLKKDATDRELVLVGRISVLIVAIVSLVLAYTPNDTILDIVGKAWAGFGSSFGPVILLSVYWKKMTKWGALAGMAVGGLTVIIWILTGLTDVIYEMIPGFFLSMLAVIVVSKLTTNDDPKVEEQYEEMEKQLAKNMK